MRKILKIQVILGVIALGLYIFGAYIMPWHIKGCGWGRALIEVPIGFTVFLLIVVIAILENYYGMKRKRNQKG